MGQLSRIVGRIWDGLEGVDLSSAPPIASALWLDDRFSTDYSSVTTADEGTAAPCDHESICGLEEVHGRYVSSDVHTEAAEGLAFVEDEPSVESDRLDLAPGIPQHRAAEEMRGAGAASINATSSAAYDRVPPGLVNRAGLEEPALAAVPVVAEDYIDDYAVFGGNLPNGEGAAKGFGKGKGKDGKGKGKGKGANGGFRNVVVGANAARDAMDTGLQAALDGLAADLLRRMEAFADDRVAGLRVKLPLNLKAKQRKAVHLWAEMHGLEHKSFGYRGRRRLHLTVPGTRCAENDSAEADFDWAAWEGEEEEWDADE